MIRRSAGWQQRLVAGALLAAVTLAACGPFYDGLPLDPGAAHLEPNAGHDAARLRTIGSAEYLTPGLEGAVLFIRLVDAAGDTIMDTYFRWPTDGKSIPPGRYLLSTYWRTCEGNCGALDPPMPFCSGRFEVAPRGRVEVRLTPGQLASGWTCDVTVVD